MTFVPLEQWCFTLSRGKSVVYRRYICIVDVGFVGKIDRLKACRMKKGYIKVFGLDYEDTFSPVVQMAFFACFLSMSAIHRWPLHWLDIKNPFLYVYGDLTKKVYMEQPLGFVDQGSVLD